MCIEKERNTLQLKKKAYGISMRAIADHEKKVVEKKRKWSELLTPVTVSTSGFMLDLASGIFQGVDSDERVGDQISLKNLVMRSEMIYQDPTNIIRVIIFKWFEDNVPIASSILEQTSTLNNRPLAPTVWTKRSQFRVLYDNTFGLSQDGQPVIVEKIFLKNLGKLHFDLSSSSYTKGGIYMYIVSDSQVSGPTFHLGWSLSYTD